MPAKAQGLHPVADGLGGLVGKDDVKETVIGAGGHGIGGGRFSRGVGCSRSRGLCIRNRLTFS
jgi:hypothetical protein